MESVMPSNHLIHLLNILQKNSNSRPPGHRAEPLFCPSHSSWELLPSAPNLKDSPPGRPQLFPRVSLCLETTLFSLPAFASAHPLFPSLWLPSTLLLQTSVFWTAFPACLLRAFSPRQWKPRPQTFREGRSSRLQKWPTSPPCRLAGLFGCLRYSSLGLVWPPAPLLVLFGMAVTQFRCLSSSATHLL